MKSIAKKSVIILFLTGIMIASTAAQAPARRGNGAGQNWNNERQPGAQIEKILPDLTEDQLSALKELRMDHLKTMKNNRNKMGEIKAKQRTIMSSDPIDQKAAAKLIDEKGELMKEQMKEQLAHKVAMQEILSEDQYLVLEQHMQKRKRIHNHYKNGQGGRGNAAIKGGGPQKPGK